MKRNSIKLILCIVAGMALLTSCRKENTTDLKHPSRDQVIETFTEQFEAIWHGLDNSYVFWSRDNTDWDAIYSEYHPKFEELDDHFKSVTDDELKALYNEVVGGLLDHHFRLKVKNLNTKGVISIGGSATDEHAERGDEPGISWAEKKNAVQACTPIMFYEKTEDEAGGPNIMAALLPMNDGGDKIAYLAISGFSISNLFTKVSSSHSVNFDPKYDAFVAPLLLFYGQGWMRELYNGSNYSNTDNLKGFDNGWINESDVKGIIIDVRGNGGGNANELKFIAGGLTQSPTHYGYARYKEGVGRLDYSAWTPFYIHTPENHLQTAKPIVVLANRGSASCAELTTQTIKSLPNGHFIGRRTYGATCPLLVGSGEEGQASRFELLYSGVFGDPSVSDYVPYFVYTANYDVVTTDYTSLEGTGITPDQDVPYDKESGEDAQLKAAIQYLQGR